MDVNDPILAPFIEAMDAVNSALETLEGEKLGDSPTSEQKAEYLEVRTLIYRELRWTNRTHGLKAINLNE